MTTTDAWHGVAAEQADEVSDEAGVRLRRRSRALLGSLLRPYRRRVAVASLLLVVQNISGLAGPFLISVGIDAGLPPLVNDGDGSVVFAVAAALAGATVVEYAARRAYLEFSARITHGILYDLRRRAFAHLQRLSPAFHERYTSGRVISRLTSDVDALTDLLDGSLDDLVIQGLNVLVIGVILLVLDWRMGLLTLVAFPFLALIIGWFRRRSGPAYRRTRETVALVIVHIVETLGGMRAVQAFRREPRNNTLFGGLATDLADADRRVIRLMAVFAPGVYGVSIATTALVLGVGGWLAASGHLQVGVLTAILLYTRRFFDPMTQLSMFYNSLQAATAALEKISGVLEEQSEIAPPADPVPLPVHAGRGRQVELRGVRFGYRDDRIVLPNLDLTIPAGQTVALLGSTGAGKSTVARLIARFYDPLGGSVRLDGVDLREVDEAALQAAIITVTQENFLFRGSVADNIRFGRPDASRAQVEAAAAEVGAERMIRALPAGFDTPVGERGTRLSAGQRQLVAFARAVLADPDVLILDEATSSLDIPSERAVQQALRTLLADRTAVIIAHRLSTVEIADRVLILDAGGIVEDGPPAELLASGGRYTALQELARR
ncbi:ABC transporter ATP-binding protein [Cryptosporangium aurantiacum]|uniref:ABC-type multidrug transport system, ATPase and permease component n=1 Tax=Cryptosporangium aurantiacum TaxID=134849 RepID=A0A1M7QRA0_9ACTN|nr:ABC transporter ATP-binding protein [Cryptosporangium aurantiacum]SHN34181.1 ABC-type multidrug transport system, ATPase and permease component [Cryptosporangium aurantiacum]